MKPRKNFDEGGCYPDLAEQKRCSIDASMGANLATAIQINILPEKF